MKDNVENSQSEDGYHDPDHDPSLDSDAVDEEHVFQNENSSNDPDKQTRLDKLLEYDRPTLVKQCKVALHNLNHYETERSETNADMSAIRKGLYARGITKDALTAAIKVSKFKEKDMDGFFLSLGILLEAVDVSHEQLDMFNRNYYRSA